MLNRRGFLFFSGATLAVVSAGVLMPIRAWRRWVTREDFLNISGLDNPSFKFMQGLPEEFWFKSLRVELPDDVRIEKRLPIEIARAAPEWVYGVDGEIVNARELGYTPRTHDLRMATELEAPKLEDCWIV